MDIGFAQQKMFDEEIAAAAAASDTNLVRMLQLASIKQLDSYKVDKKLLDDKGSQRPWHARSRFFTEQDLRAVVYAQER